MSAASAGLANAAIAKLAYRIFFIFNSPPGCESQGRLPNHNALRGNMGVAPAQQLTENSIYCCVLGSITAIEKSLTWYRLPGPIYYHKLSYVCLPTYAPARAAMLMPVSKD